VTSRRLARGLLGVSRRYCKKGKPRLSLARGAFPCGVIVIRLSTVAAIDTIRAVSGSPSRLPLALDIGGHVASVRFPRLHDWRIGVFDNLWRGLAPVEHYDVTWPLGRLAAAVLGNIHLHAVCHGARTANEVCRADSLFRLKGPIVADFEGGGEIARFERGLIDFDAFSERLLELRCLLQLPGATEPHSDNGRLVRSSGGHRRE
jgi:hypothetical protein